ALQLERTFCADAAGVEREPRVVDPVCERADLSEDRLPAAAVVPHERTRELQESADRLVRVPGGTSRRDHGVEVLARSEHVADRAPCETALTSNVDADRRADRLRAAVGALERARPARLGLAVGVPPRGVPCRRPQVLDRAAMVACLFEMERELGGPLPRPGAEHVLLVP